MPPTIKVAMGNYDYRLNLEGLGAAFTLINASNAIGLTRMHIDAVAHASVLREEWYGEERIREVIEERVERFRSTIGTLGWKYDGTYLYIPDWWSIVPHYAVRGFHQALSVIRYWDEDHPYRAEFLANTKYLNPPRAAILLEYATAYPPRPSR